MSLRTIGGQVADAIVGVLRPRTNFLSDRNDIDDINANFAELDVRAGGGGIANAKLDGVTDDSAALAAALLVIGTNRAGLSITGPMLINSNLTIPSNVQLSFVGTGQIKPAANKTVTINGAIRAGAWQIFDTSNSGAVVTGSIRNPEVSVEWFGAAADNSTASGAAINNALAMGLASGIPVRLLGGTYKTQDATISLGGTSFTRPSIIGTSKKQTILDYSAAGASFIGIKIRGGSGQVTGDAVKDLTLVGHSTSIGIEFNGACGANADNVLFGANAIGIQCHNETSGSFTEFCTATRCEQSTACAKFWTYKVTSGNNSFHGSGPGGGLDNIVQCGASQTIVVHALGTGCFVYHAPCNLQVFSTAASVTVFQNDNSVAPVPLSYYGSLSIETSSARTITLGGGAGVYFIGGVRVIGMTTATGANIVAGTFLRVKTVQVHSDSSTSFTGGESGRTFNNVTDTTLVDCGMKNVHRLVDVNISFANYIKRYTLDVDYNGDGSTSTTPIIMEMTQNSSVATAAVIPRILLDGTTGLSGSPNFTGNADGTFNIVSAFTNMTATGAFSGGETQVTFTGNWTHPTGTHYLKFSNGDLRTATLTNGSAGPFNLSSALSSAATTTVASTMWPSTGVTIQVYETQMSNGLQGSGHMTF